MQKRAASQSPADSAPEHKRRTRNFQGNRLDFGTLEASSARSVSSLSASTGSSGNLQSPVSLSSSESVRFSTPATPASPHLLRNWRSLSSFDSIHQDASVDTGATSTQSVPPIEHSPGDFTHELDSLLGRLAHILPNVSRTAQISTALSVLKNARLSPLELVTHLATPSVGEGKVFRTRWYNDKGVQLVQFLSAVLSDERGHRKLTNWMHPHALDFVHRLVASEMQKVQEHLRMPSLEHVTPDFVDEWTHQNVVDPLSDIAPTLHGILISAATAKHTGKNKLKKPDLVCCLIYPALIYTTTYAYHLVLQSHTCADR
jgi:hypothetical protein